MIENLKHPEALCCISSKSYGIYNLTRVLLHEYPKQTIFNSWNSIVKIKHTILTHIYPESRKDKNILLPSQFLTSIPLSISIFTWPLVLISPTKPSVAMS